jgi:uncharacterized membrane protein
MIAHLTTAVTVTLVFVNLVGLALLTRRLAGSYVLARAASPVAFALALFFLEHFVGLGTLCWAWPIATAAAAWRIARERDVVAAHWPTEAVFLAGFGWAFAWRFAFPGLGASSEKIGDLAMISTYLPGHRLPAMDAWYPPYPFDMYYAFQHYAAALLGRIFGLSPGFTYNLAFAVVIALTITAAAGFVASICASRVRASLVVFAFVAGGTGATIPVHFMVREPYLWASMRFIGGSATRQFADTPVGKAVVAATVNPSTTPMTLPSETFAYLLWLGDYHPMLSGFFLLALALLCIGLIESGESARGPYAVLAATPVLCLVANGWTLPLQAALVATYILSRVFGRERPDWREIAAGVAGAFILCQPFLARFAYHSADYGVRLRVVPPAEHTPVALGLVLLYPTIVAIVLPLVAGERRRWLVWSSILWLGLLAASEVFYIDDIYGGTYNRFNTTLKWWPWIQAGALLTAGAYAVQSASRVLRWTVVAVLVAVSTFGWDQARVFATSPKPELGQMDGAGWITSDAIEKAVFEYLKAQPRGIVLQRVEKGAFTPAPGLTLLAGHVAFLGWSEHEKLWRGQRADVEIRAKEVRAFYSGALPDSVTWLTMNGIDHVLWLRSEINMPPGTFDRIDQALRGGYYWREFYRNREFRVGIWSRIPGARQGAGAPAPSPLVPGNEPPSTPSEGQAGPTR